MLKWINCLRQSDDRSFPKRCRSGSGGGSGFVGLRVMVPSSAIESSLVPPTSLDRSKYHASPLADTIAFPNIPYNLPILLSIYEHAFLNQDVFQTFTAEVYVVLI
jgi:hypothetical protein